MSLPVRGQEFIRLGWREIVSDSCEYEGGLHFTIAVSCVSTSNFSIVYNRSRIKFFEVLSRGEKGQKTKYWGATTHGKCPAHVLDEREE